MKFFQDRRVSVYFKGGSLKQDPKTEKRYWSLKLAISLKGADVYSCSEMIVSNFEQITARENGVDEIKLGCTLWDVAATFFAVDQAGAPEILRLSGCMVTDFKMAHDDGLTELWVHLEHENNSSLHTFVKDYAFTRFWMEFVPEQRGIFDKPASGVEEAMNKLQNLADKDSVTMTLTQGGKKLAEFKPKKGTTIQ